MFVQHPTIIRQKAGNDCVTCSFAMAFGLTYEAIEVALNKLFDDGIEDVMEALCLIGQVNLSHADNLVEGRPALVVVPSGIDPNDEHVVYYDGISVYDPQGFYFEFDQLEPLEVIA